jgi:nitrogen-specific signal transduction histidine kinase
MSFSSSSVQYKAEQKTLSPADILALHDLLRDVRHGIRNDIAVIVAIAELIRVRPDLLDTKLSQVSVQTARLVERLEQFSAEFEKSLGVVRTRD